MFTCSYDGSIRILDPTIASFRLGLSDGEAQFSAFDVTADGRSGFVGDKDGNLEVLDFRAASCVQSALSLHDRKINTLHVRCGPFLSTASCQAEVASKALFLAEHVDPDLNGYYCIKT